MTNKHSLTFCSLFLALLLLGNAGLRASAAELVLRKRTVPSGPLVRLGDVADVGAHSTSQLDDLTTTALMPAPAPGTRLFLRRSQIRELLASRGVDTRGLLFSGADFVEIGSLGDSSIESPDANQSRVSREVLKATILEAIENHLHKQAMHSQWQIELDINEASYKQLAQLGTKLIASGGRKPWRGRQQFQLTNQSVRAGSSQNFVRVRTQIVRSQRAIVALRAIPRGGLIRSSDVELRLHTGNVPAHATISLEQVVGKEARQSVSADAFVLENQVRAPLLVKRGDSVALFARTAGITVRTTAIAREEGSMGELIVLETLSNKEQLSAQVTGRGEATVFTTGASAADFATLNRRSENRQ